MTHLGAVSAQGPVPSYSLSLLVCLELTAQSHSLHPKIYLHGFILGFYLYS